MASVTTEVGTSQRGRPAKAPKDDAPGGEKLKAAFFAAGLLIVTIAVLVGIFMAVGEKAPPAAYPGLNGFPNDSALTTKSGADLVAFVFAFITGFLIQRSRWCNASAVRDAVLFKSFRNTKPLVATMIIITTMFTIFEAAHLGKPMNLVGGAFTVLGLFLFGIGMVLGGACTVSVWIRSAEGSIGALWALLYTFVGMFLFSELWNVFRWPAASYLQSPKPNLSILSFGAFNAFSLAKLFGPTWGPVAIVVAGGLQVAVLALIYKRMVRTEAKSRGASDGAGSRRAEMAPLTVEEILTPTGPASKTLGDAEPAGSDGGEPVPVGAVAGGDAGGHHRMIPLERWADVEIDKVLDCSGEMCPRPQLLTKKAIIKEMSVGQVLELVVDNPSSPELVPTIMSDIGAVHLGTERDANAWHLYIRKERDAQRTKGGSRR